MTPTPRRWFRFSLRTLFVVVTVVGLFVGYHVNWIRQRRDALSLNSYYGAIPSVVEADSGLNLPRPSSPGLLAIFGERGYEHISVQFDKLGPLIDPLGTQDRELTNSELAEVDRIRRLFPEAEISTWAWTLRPEGIVEAEQIWHDARERDKAEGYIVNDPQ